MPSSSDTASDTEVSAVVGRYRRLERLLTAVTVLLAVALALALVVSLPFLPGLVGALAVGVAARVPVFRTEGTATLLADADPERVRADFTGPRPPPLAFQWGLADDVDPTDDGAVFDITYLFGLRSVRMATETRSLPDGDLELVVTAGGRPWGSYTVSIREGDDGRTAVAFDWEADRRFGLRRLPAWFAAERYRERALAAQGYTVRERTASVGVR